MSQRVSTAPTVSVEELLERLRAADVRVWLDGPHLRCSAPAGAVTAEIRDELRARRDEIRLALGGTPVAAVSAPADDHSAPLTLAQERLWFFHQLEPASAAYNMSIVLALTGPLDRPALERALGVVVERHAILRTLFRATTGEPRQYVQRGVSVPLGMTDLSDRPAATRASEAETIWKKEAEQTFDLANDLPLRTRLVRLADREHYLLVTMHHIAADGGSLVVFMREMVACYRAGLAGDALGLAPVPIQYADLARRERAWLASPDCEKTLAFWLDRFSGDVPVLDLPADHVRPAVQTFRGGLKHATLPPDVAAAIRALSRTHGCTPFMTLLAAFKAVLFRCTGATDIVVGSPMAGRDSPETRELIGLFINTLALRSNLSGNPTFEALLGRVRATCLTAYAHQELPFAKLIETIRPQRDLSRTPLFQVMFNMFGLAVDEFADVGELRIQPPPTARLVTAFDVQSKFDLTLYARETAAGIELVLVYNADLFSDARMETFLQYVQAMTSAVASAPQVRIGDVVLDPEAVAQGGRRAVHALRPASFDPMAEDVVRGSIPERFRAVAARHADRVAVSTRDASWTYRELSDRARRVAAGVGAAAHGAATRVALLCEHAPPMLAAIVGVLDQGSAYVPLDPRFPEERLALIVADVEAGVIVADPQHAAVARAIAGTRPVVFTDVAVAPAVPGASPATAASPAYVLYTSGSTGRPKGVVQTHAGVLHHARTYAGSIEITPEDRVLLVASYTFDAAVMDIFGALLSGAELHLVNVPAEGLDAVAAAIAASRVTLYHSTPTVYRALVPMLRPEQCAAVRAVVLGGEEVRPRDLALFRGLMRRGAVFVNGLGPTESTTALQFFDDGREASSGLTVPVGHPVANTSVLLLDEAGAVTPVTGEIAIVSPYVAAGYWRQPELTARAFGPAPGRPDSRMYRTGDLGRRRPDGAIEFLGRNDHQVKIRGVRIELGEIESCLESHPAVQLAAATATKVAGADERTLAAFVALGAGASATSAELKDYLAGRLPGYMVPGALVIVASLPLTPTGKIDRRALPAVPAALTESPAFVAPRDAMEEVVAEIWTDVLQRPRIGVHEDFFALGGHSLHATQVMSRLRAVLGLDVPLRALFMAPTIEGLSKVLRDRQAHGAAAVAPLVARGRGDGLTPLSYSQDRMWFLQQLMPDSTAYNVIAAATLNGPLDRDAFVGSLEDVVRRHDILRATFVTPAGVPMQHVADALPLPLTEIDVRALPADRRLAEATRVASERSMQPFDLERGPLWWVMLVRVEDERHVLAFGFHHIISDLWSFGVLGRELARLYTARLRGGEGLPAPALQYSDYAVWQREWLEGPRLDEQLAYWMPQLANLAPLDVPTDRPRPAVMRPNGDRRSIGLSEALVERVRALSAREGATPFMTFLAAFNVLLSRYSGQQDIAVGVPIANRTHVGVESLIGTFVNTLVHRNDLSGNPSFRDALRRVRRTALDAFAHQDLPFERLVRELAPDRDVSRSPVFQVMFNMANVPLGASEMPGITVEPLEIERRSAQFDLSMVVRTGDAAGIVVTFNRDLFDGEWVERFLRHYLTVLDEATRTPEREIGVLAIVPPAERRALVDDGNATTAEYPAVPVTALIAAQAAMRPDAIALEDGEERIRYDELERRANRLARRIARHGITPGSLVGVCLDRSSKMVIALLGVMKAGCAYIPIDPGFPAQRVKFMIDDSRAAAIVVETKTTPRLPPSDALTIDLDAEAAGIANEAGDALEDAPSLDAPAYVLYTSGSTGSPKGVQIPHRALVNFLASMQRSPGISADDVLLAVTTISFDIAGLELYLPLMAGGTVALASREVAADGRRLCELLKRRQPTVLQATPATWRSLIDAGWAPGDTPALRVFCGGEALPPDLAVALLARASEVWNLYGPTETTIWSTVHRVAAGGSTVPIGRPIANTQVYVLDQHGQPTPMGVPGELYIGGDGVANGYLHRPELTAERFVPNPFVSTPGARMYRTGDRARFRTDGALEHLGRLDHQVKLRGYRIELGEIEAALSAQPEIARAVVDVRRDRLVAYVVFEGAEELTASEIRARLRDTLPEYMIPSLVVPLDGLPLTPNGKVDRRALPDPLRTTARAAATHVAPSTATEIAIADVWRGILGIERVSTTDNFFELGGHSLLSIRAVHEIQRKTGWRPDPRLLFFETLGRIAAGRTEGA